jgi:iron complex transport system substrate-binding protein
VFTDLAEDDSALSTVTIQMESFYAQARDADVLIYNSTASVDVHTMEELMTLCPQLKDFKAVREGRVWCTEQSMFQRSSAAAEMIADFHEILQEAPREDSLTYLHKIV